jgi:hypothetical protein
MLWPGVRWSRSHLDARLGAETASYKLTEAPIYTLVEIIALTQPVNALGINVYVAPR